MPAARYRGDRANAPARARGGRCVAWGMARPGRHAAGPLRHRRGDRDAERRAAAPGPSTTRGAPPGGATWGRDLAARPGGATWRRDLAARPGGATRRRDKGARYWNAVCGARYGGRSGAGIAVPDRAAERRARPWGMIRAAGAARDRGARADVIAPVQRRSAAWSPPPERAAPRPPAACRQPPRRHPTPPGTARQRWPAPRAERPSHAPMQIRIDPLCATDAYAG
jgi:hypothetical protein